MWVEPDLESHTRRRAVPCARTQAAGDAAVRFRFGRASGHSTARRPNLRRAAVDRSQRRRCWRGARRHPAERAPWNGEGGTAAGKIYARASSRPREHAGARSGSRATSIVPASASRPARRCGRTVTQDATRAPRRERRRAAPRGDSGADWRRSHADRLDPGPPFGRKVAGGAPPSTTPTATTTCLIGVPARWPTGRGRLRLLRSNGRGSWRAVVQPISGDARARTPPGPCVRGQQPCDRRGERGSRPARPHLRRPLEGRSARAAFGANRRTSNPSWAPRTSCRSTGDFDGDGVSDGTTCAHYTLANTTRAHAGQSRRARSGLAPTQTPPATLSPEARASTECITEGGITATGRAHRWRVDTNRRGDAVRRGMGFRTSTRNRLQTDRLE